MKDSSPVIESKGQDPNEHGIERMTLNMKALYPEELEREKFRKRFHEFCISEPIHKEIFSLEGETLIYQTECIIPGKTDQRPPLLFVAGNPASHSVNEKMFFAHEGQEEQGREHRFWRILRKADILSFPSISERESLGRRNRSRKTALYELSYESRFRIGLAVFYTMPSPASQHAQAEGNWAGVNGLRRLFRKDGLAKIGECEKRRMDRIIRDFVSPNGAVMALQKDAYLGLKSSTSPNYSLKEASDGRLVGSCECELKVRLFCTPPTRRLEGKINILRRFREQILHDSNTPT
jgi:hypothetical protein